jgi:uncharacterized ion transporter superfamily protein YfcC
LYQEILKQQTEKSIVQMKQQQEKNLVPMNEHQTEKNPIPMTQEMGLILLVVVLQDSWHIFVRMHGLEKGYTRTGCLL